MPNNATITIRLQLDGGRTFDPNCFAINKRIDGPFVDAIAPVDVVSDSLMRFTSSRAVTQEQYVTFVKRRREDYVKYLAEQIAKEMMRAIEAQDLTNGYRKTDL
jgi:phosphoribulokinase